MNELNIFDRVSGGPYSSQIAKEHPSFHPASSTRNRRFGWPKPTKMFSEEVGPFGISFAIRRAMIGKNLMRRGT